ncbi:Far1-related sequence, partial [Thalictrum thalictroides]
MAEQLSEHGKSSNLEFGSPCKDVSDTIVTPFVGMTFKTSEDAKEYYEKYGVSKGFSVLRRSSQKTWVRCDTVTTILYVCSHFGSYNKPVTESVPKQKQRPNTSTMRGECQAQMKINLNPKTLEWVVRQVHDEHNHSFVSPSKKMLLKTNRKMPEAAKNMVEMFRKENLPVNKVKSIFGGDSIGFNNRACWNHLRDVRQKIDVGDAQWAFEYFQKRQLENPQFYYAIQCDGEGRA